MISVFMSGTKPRGVSTARVTKTVRAVFSKVRRAPKGNVGIRFATDKEIAGLNRRYRGKDCPTDVLSFSAGFQDSGEWGDIIIAPTYARREAARRGIPFTEEILRLVAHGTLHLLGFDHATEKDEARMFRLQESVVERVASYL